jgi:DNA repair protein RadA/Sms
MHSLVGTQASPSERPLSKAAVAMREPAVAPMRSQARCEELRRAKTHLDTIDLALGGGLVEGSTVLLSGDRGTGKSTLGLSLVAAFGREGVYVTTEETAAQVADRARRTCAAALDSPLASFVADGTEEVEATWTFGSVEHFLRLAESRRLTLLDSLHALDGSTEDNAGKIVRFAKARKTTIVCVAQLTKDGRTVRGGAAIRYFFDVEIRIERLDPENRNESTRKIIVEKNRFGPEGDWAMRLGPAGWEELPSLPGQDAAPAECSGSSGAPANLHVLRPRTGDRS